MSANLGISKFINFNSKKFSLKLFNQRLPFIYIFFNTLYLKLIVNKNVDNNILKFHNSGFTKLNINMSSIIDEYKDKFFTNEDNEKKDVKRKFLLLNDLDKKNFVLKVKNKLRPAIDQLERYFNCEIMIADIKLIRNYHHDDKDNLNVEYYSNHFHQDSYLMTYNKIFVNLMDISEDDGPLEIIPDENKNLFIKSFNYKDRDNHNTHGDNSLIYKNTGKKGDCFLFSSTRLFHRAGVPKRYRDNMSIIIVTIPKYKQSHLNIEDDSQLFDENYKFFQKFTKPYSIVKVIKIFIELFKYKFNRN